MIIFSFIIIFLALFPILWTLYLPHSIFTYPLVIYFIFIFLDRFILSFFVPFLSFNISLDIRAFDQYYSEFSNYLIYCLLLFGFFALLYLLVFTRKRALLLSELSFDDFSKSPRLLLISQFLMFSTFLSWVIVTKGIAITEPRVAYMDMRKGVGYIWALGIYTISLNAALKLIFCRLSIRSVLSNLLLPYFYASKGFVLSLIVPFMFYKGPLSLRSVFKRSILRSYFRRLPLLGVSLLALLVFTYIFIFSGGFTNENFGVVDRFLNTYSSFSTANKAVLENTPEFENIKSSIYFSSFWSWVPRSIFPDKPFAYGTVAVIDYFYPGLAEAGATPSIGLGTVEYLQFGYLGIVFNVLLNFQLVAPLAFIIILTTTRKFSYHRLKLYLFCSILISGGLTFHIPPLASFLFSLLLFRLSF